MTKFEQKFIKIFPGSVRWLCLAGMGVMILALLFSMHGQAHLYFNSTMPFDSYLFIEGWAATLLYMLSFMLLLIIPVLIVFVLITLVVFKLLSKRNLFRLMLLFLALCLWGVSFSLFYFTDRAAQNKRGEEYAKVTTIKDSPLTVRF